MQHRGMKSAIYDFPVMIVVTAFFTRLT